MTGVGMLVGMFPAVPVYKAAPSAPHIDDVVALQQKVTTEVKWEPRSFASR